MQKISMFFNTLLFIFQMFEFVVVLLQIYD